MSVNSSSLSNDSLLHPFTLLMKMRCYTITYPASILLITSSFVNIIIPLPVVILVLYYGVKQWRKNISSSSAAKISHCDSFTYHMAVIELIGMFGYILLLSFSLFYKENLKILLVGTLALFMNWYGQTFFHVLTCLERYLAVVHPIIYVNLRNEKGIRIRNTIIGCVWLVCFVMMSLVMTEMYTITDYCIYTFSLLVVFFCTVSALRVLIRPGPGDQGGCRERVDQSKQRAFYTIVAILGAQTVRFIGSLLWKLDSSSVISDGCLIMASVSWTVLPSSLVLPLLFLNRAGKLVCCRNKV